MMCTVAPLALPADCFIGAVVAPPQRTMMAACYDEAPPSPVSPMPSAEFLALSRPLPDIDVEAISTMLRGIKTMQIAAPLAYDDEHQEDGGYVIVNTKKKTEDASINNMKKMDPSWTYDTDIDATFRKMEKDPAERPSEEDYLSTTQKMTMADRAEHVAWMYELSRFHNLPPGTLHRAVSYLDRFLSAKKIDDQDDRLVLLRAVAVFVAAKYEQSTIKWVFNADDVACDVGNGCTRPQVLAAERDLVATLGYRLSGPTAYTFVDHFTRHDHEENTHHDGVAVMRALAHHIADVTLLDYRCAVSLPSAVAASAVLLARRIIISNPDDRDEEELLNMTRYKLQDLTDIIDAIYEMHEVQGVWPGCALMMANCVFSYCLPPRWC